MKSHFAHWIIARTSQWLSYEPPHSPSFLYDFDKIRFEIRPSDVLLVEGRNRVSRVIKQITQSTWSHSALYLGRLHDIDDPITRAHVQKFYPGSPDEQMIVESIMGRGTVISSLSRYKDFNIRICRPRGLNRQDAQKIINFVIKHLGSRYSVRHILDLARFLFPWGILPRRWRSSLFVHNALKPTEEICSSLIASAFQQVHFPILPEVIRDSEGLTLVSRNPRLYTPKDFDCSPFFDIIKYPMLPLISEGMYKHLPWQENKVTGDEYIRIKDPDATASSTQPQPSDSNHEGGFISLLPSTLIEHQEADSSRVHKKSEEEKKHDDSS